ncbi:hypothetical protein [Streptomyces inhibens]|uniref:hypothetical protein n=1 Tax=Streptomyces inhibens TaxID=2293571 RepID=UPI001EE6FB0F|nr:hypothetical protein [Streptomyces inhibens]UKY53420.1 hypothetical protein KI385_34545 [Streptomyces inhibens]
MNDDELLARLRAIDPARTSHAPPPHLDRLLEATMTADTKARSTENGSGGRRRHLVLAAAAAAVLAVGGGIAWGMAPTSNPSPSASSPSPAGPLTLTVPEATTAKCAAVTVDTLRSMQTAFEGTATSVKGNQVELRVDHWYHGGDASIVRLRNDTEMVPLLSGVEFKVGRRYLVTADDGRVSLCGYSAEANPQLRALYNKAYPR